MVLRTTPVLVLLITNRFETWFTIVFTLQCHQRRGAGFSSPSTMTLNLDISNVMFRVARENLKCYPPAIKHGNENPANSIFFPPNMHVFSWWMYNVLSWVSHFNHHFPCFFPCCPGISQLASSDPPSPPSSDKSSQRPNPVRSHLPSLDMPGSSGG